MITGFFFYILALVPSVLLQASCCGILHVVGARLLSSSGGNDLISHAFVQTDSELHYFRDVSSQEVAFVNKSPETGPTSDSELHFEPSELEFTTSFLGMPKRVAVTVHNPSEAPAIVHAIFSKSMDFYFSFPEDKIIKPKRSSKFVVTFLPRSEGSTSTVLNIHTSVGIFPYKIVASAKENPYRIQPVVRARLPINGSFEFPVYLHNPHPEKLRLVDAFSSHAELFLMHKRPGIQMEIAPFETVQVARGVVTGVTETNLTVFIMLKMDVIPYDESQTKLRDIQLVVAVDLDVTSKQGLFSTADILDFGLIKYGDRSKRLIFKAYSTMEKGLEIDSVYVESSNVQTNGIYMQFATKPPITVKSKSRTQPGSPVPIANVEIDSSFLSLNKSQKIHHVDGVIVAESRGGNFNATIRFQADIFIGEILHTSKDAAFHREVQPPAKRSVSLHNDYPFGLGIWNISIGGEAHKYFKVSLVRPVVEIEPNKTSPVVLIDYIKKPPEDYSTICTLYTNVTTFEFSIFIFMGEISITVHSLGRTETPFDFGLIKPGTRRSIFFTVSNPNSIILALRNLDHPLPGFTKLEPIETQSIESANSKSIKTKETHLQWAHGADFLMPANSFTLFNFSVIVPPFAKNVKPLSLKLVTDYKRVTLAAIYELTNSTITFVDRTLNLQDSFPGRVVSKNIKIYSSFKEDLRVLGLAILDKDPRFYFKLKPKSDLILKSQAITSLGHVCFSQSLACTSSCYTGFPLHTADGQWFNYGLKLPQNLAEIDSYLYTRLKRRFNAIEDKKLRSTVVLDTEKAKSFDAIVETELVWPKLFSHPVVHFPLTAVGNFSILNLTLTNPSVHPVIVQLLPLVIYPDAEAFLDFFYEEFGFPIKAPVEMNETLMFSLRDTELFTLKAGSPVPKLREELEKVVGGPVPRFTLSMILQPGMSVRVRIGFLPTDYTLRSSLLLIRNNLTAIEPVVLYGKGAHINMEIDGKLARSEDYLLFDILPVHLADCSNPKRLTHKLPTTLTVKRSFVVKNTGEVKFTITNIGISGTPCKDRGFRVLNCKPFTLAPNETHTLEIAYTPDFLMSVNEATLQLTMGYIPDFHYNMVATIASEMLPLCHTALPRPPFEWVMYYSCMFALVFCMICVVACAYLEGDRFITTMTQQQSETLSEKDAATVQSKTDKSDTQSTSDQKEGGFFHRLFYGPRDHSYLSALEFGTGPISNVVEKCCNYVIWICANVLMIVRGESGRSSGIKRNKRHRRRFAAAGFNVVHEPPTETSIKSINKNPPAKQIAQLGKAPINNFSDSMSSTRSQDDENKSGAESTQSGGLKKRKNVSKKNSNESQNETPQSVEPKLKPVIKVSAMQAVERTNHVAKKPEPKVVEQIEALEKMVEEIQPSKLIDEEIQPTELVDEEIQPIELVEEPTIQEKQSAEIELVELKIETSTLELSELQNHLELSDQASIELKFNDEEHSNTHEDDRVDLSDSSAIPEWAEVTVAQGNHNDEFDKMVKQSSAFFSPGRTSSAMSNSSQLSQSDNIQPSSSVEDNKKRKRRTKRKKVEPNANSSMKVWLTKKEINRLTNEYKQQLEAMASNMRHGDTIPNYMPFTSPPFMSNPIASGLDFTNLTRPLQHTSASQPDYYAEFLRIQNQFQRDPEMQRQLFGQRSNMPQTSQSVGTNQQISPVPWSTGESSPSSSRAFGVAPSNANNLSGNQAPLPNQLFSNTENSMFSPLSNDLFTELDSSQPMRASSSFFDSIAQLTNVEEDPNNQFLSLYSDDDHVWKPIDENDTNKASLWPDLLKSTKKKEE